MINRRIYKPGSPGAKRAREGLTLTAIKHLIALSPDRGEARRAFQERGLLGRRAA